MAMTSANVDVYVGDELRHAGAMVIDRNEHRQLVVKAPFPDRPSAWQTVLVLTDVEPAGSQGTALFWVGNDPEGVSVRLAAVPRKSGGCVPCGNG